MSKILSYSLSVAMLGLGYFVAGQLGWAIAAENHGIIEIIWPPAGVALAVLLRYGMGLWPGVLLGGIALGWGAGFSWGEIAATTLGSTFVALAGASLLRRSRRFDWRLDHLDHMLTLAIYGGVLAGLIGGVTTALGAMFAGDHTSGLLTVGAVGWLGNAGGVLLVTPLLLLWGSRESAGERAQPGGEALVAFVLLMLATALAFGLLFVGREMALPLAFAPVPFLVWIALRLPLSWIALAVLLTVVIAGFASANGHGPFGHYVDAQRQLLVWTFGVAVGVTTLLLGMATEGKRRATERLRYLGEVVRRLGGVHSVSELMTVVRPAARRLTGADGATLVLREGDRCHYADEDAIGPLWKGQRFPLETCISGWVMLNDEPAAIEDIYADPRIPQAAYRPTFVRSLTMVPIGHSESRGAIGCYWADSHRASREELELQQALAEAVGVALANIDLYQRLDAMRCDAEASAVALGMSEQRHRSLFEQATIGLAEADLAGRLLRLNPGFQRLLGYREAELLGRPVSDITHPDDIARNQEQIGRLTRGEFDGFDMVKRYLRKDGGIRWGNVSTYLIRDAEDRPQRIAAVVQDITEQHEMEEKARQQRRELARAQQRTVVAEVATQLAAELNQPLAALTNYCETAASLAAQVHQPPPQLRSVLENACEEAQRAGGVARRLRGLVDGEREPRDSVDLDQLIENTLGSLAAEFARAGAHVRCEAGAAPARVTVERRQIEQVLFALLSNSLEAIERAAVPVREIVVRTAREAGRVAVSVAGSGPGLALLPVSGASDIWESGHRHGQGIPLAACGTILEAHGGQLRVESVHDGGAAMCFTLPLADPAQTGTEP